jgi:hypothetical protein
MQREEMSSGRAVDVAALEDLVSELLAVVVLLGQEHVDRTGSLGVQRGVRRLRAKLADRPRLV